MFAEVLHGVIDVIGVAVFACLLVSALGGLCWFIDRLGFWYVWRFIWKEKPPYSPWKRRPKRPS